LGENNEQTSDEDHAVCGSKSGTDELQQKIQSLLRRLAESRRREQELTYKFRELEDINDTPEQKIQQIEKLLFKNKAGWL